MTNNEKLLIIQRKFGLSADDIKEVCMCKSAHTVYGWRQQIGASRYRGMRDQPYKLLTDWLIREGKVGSEEELNTILEEAA